MPVYKFGEIVLVRFHPAYGEELRKYRPAVIIRDLFPINPRFIQIVPLTSQTTIKNRQSELIIKHPSLEGKSLLLSWYVMTFDSTRVVHRLGKLNHSDQTRLLKIISSPSQG